MTATVILLFSLCLTLHQCSSFKILESAMLPNRPNIAEYNVTREKLLNDHLRRGLGFDEELDENEEKLNAILMQLKFNALNRGFKNPSDFPASHHVFDVLDDVKKSPLFQLIKKMPKGAILHSHDTSIASTNYVLSLTYWPNLWQSGEITDQPKFLFSAQQPSPEWKLVADERARLGKDEYDKHARKLFTLFVKNPQEKYKDINSVWSTFMKIFITFEPIVTYVPVWKDYFYNCLKESYEDGVQILEFRGVLPQVSIQIGPEKIVIYKI
jgi:adenosine deaminase CECR1